VCVRSPDFEVVQLDTFCVNLEGQGHRSKFNVAGGNDAKVGGAISGDGLSSVLTDQFRLVLATSKNTRRLLACVFVSDQCGLSVSS